MRILEFALILLAQYSLGNSNRFQRSPPGWDKFGGQLSGGRPPPAGPRRCQWQECYTYKFIYILALSDKTTKPQYYEVIKFLNDTMKQCPTTEYTVYEPSEQLLDNGRFTWCTYVDGSCDKALRELDYKDTVIDTSSDYSYGTPSTTDGGHYPSYSEPEPGPKGNHQYSYGGDYMDACTSHTDQLVYKVVGVVLYLITDCDCTCMVDILARFYQLHYTAGYEAKVAAVGKQTAMSALLNQFDNKPLEVVFNYSGLFVHLMEDAKACSAVTTDLKIDTPSPNNVTGSSTNFLALYIALPIAITVIFVALLIFFYQRNKWKWKNKIAKLRAKNEQNNSQTDSGRYIDMHTMEEHKTDDWELPRNRVSIYYESKLGSGAFSTVYKGYLLGEAPVCKIQGVSMRRPITDCEIAVKILPDYADAMAKSDFVQEMNFMKDLGYHPYLVSLIGCISVDQPLCLLTEYCQHGDLLHYVRNKKEEILQALSSEESLRFRDLLTFCWQVSDGMVYLSSKDCIHRDLAARNVLIDFTKTAKLGDFGLCRLLDRAIYTTRGGRLPIKWMALESLRFYEYSSMSDVWSFGVLLYEVFSLGEVPYPQHQAADMVKILTSGERMTQPEHCPVQIYELMRSCWRENPHSRPTFEQISQQLLSALEGATESYGYINPVSELYTSFNPTDD